jgi:hypothetical protein
VFFLASIVGGFLAVCMPGPVCLSSSPGTRVWQSDASSLVRGSKMPARGIEFEFLPRNSSKMPARAAAGVHACSSQMPALFGIVF